MLDAAGSRVVLSRAMNRDSVFAHCFSWLLLCIWAAMICGCTYSFTGSLRSDVKTIAIPMFENTTLKYGLETVFTDAAVNAFVSDGRLKVVSEKKADSVLLCSVTEFSRAAFSYDESGDVKQDKVTVTLDVLYKKTETDEVIFERSGFAEWSTYFLDTETEEEAISAAAAKFGQDLVREIASAW